MKVEVGLEHECGSGLFGAIDDRVGALSINLGQGLEAGRHGQVAAEQQVGLAGRHPRHLDGILLRGDAQVADHGAELLRQAGLVQRRAAPSLKVRGHGHKRGQGHDAGAADAGHDGIPRPVQAGQRRLRQRCKRLVVHGLAFGQIAPKHRDETGAESVEATEVLVASALVDTPFAAQLGFAGHHRQAIGRLAAVAAALANRFIDEGSPRRVRHQSPLAAAAPLSGAGLGVNDHRDPPMGSQRPLQSVQLVAMMNAVAGLILELAPPSLRVIRDQGNAPHALSGQLAHQFVHRQVPVDGLATGHGHRLVEEDLVGDVQPRRQGGADGQRAGVEVGAVAQVLKHVRGMAERRLADPGRPFAAHLGVGAGRPVRHPGRHVVAADAAQGVAAFRHTRRTVVWTAGAEVGRALRGGTGAGQRSLLGVKEVQPRLHGLGSVKAGQAPGDGPGHQRRRQFTSARHQVPALLVEFANHPGTAGHRIVVQLAG